MTIRHILVHVDLAPGGERRLRLAADLARRFGAELIGTGLAEDDLETGDGEAMAPAEALFRAALSGGLSGDWRPAGGIEESFIADQARTADLVVLGQRDPGGTAGVSPEGVIVACGRPVIVVPCTAPSERVGGTVLVAWNGSREAVHAVRMALPLLVRADRVVVLSVNPPAAEDWGGRGLAHDLVRQGAPATAETVTPEGRSPAEGLRACAAEMGADLIVMGAFRRSPLRETLLGGTTDAMLRSMDVPVLMAH